jgi:tellurium resistance protein TerD
LQVFLGSNFKTNKTMSYQLSKGSTYAIAKAMTKCYLGLGWDVNYNTSAYPFDLDVVALITDQANKLLPEPNGVVFYNNPTFPNCSWQNNGSRNEIVIKNQPVWLSADNRDGTGDGDDEYLHIDFAKLPPNVTQITIAVVLYDGELRKQSFGQLQNAFIRVAQGENYPDLARYEINQKFTNETCLIFGRLFKKDNSWTFEAVGKANKFDLGQLINEFSRL